MIDERLVVLDSPLNSRASIIDFLSGEAKRMDYLNDREEYVRAVNERELEFSTAIGYDVSIPHGKSAEVSTPFVCFLRTKEQVEWDEKGNLVKLVFLLGVPEQQKDKLHLRILAEISKKLMDENFREELAKGNKESVMKMLTKIEDMIIK